MSWILVIFSWFWVPMIVRLGDALFPALSSAGNYDTEIGFNLAIHQGDLQGLIGPNLADNYWIHGGSNVDVFNVVSKGVLDKGMPGWEAAYSAEQRAQMVASISQLTVDTSRSGQTAVSQTIQSMSGIKLQVENIADNILALSKRTQQIGEQVRRVGEKEQP